MFVVGCSDRDFLVFVVSCSVLNPCVCVEGLFCLDIIGFVVGCF